jgi:hypothetical protein
MKITDIAMPPGVMDPIPVVALSKEVAWAFAEPQRMLHVDWEKRMNSFEIRPYNDPVLRSSKTRWSGCSL